MNYIEQYANEIYTGNIVACDLIKRQYDRLINAAAHPKEYHLDTDISNRHIDFIEKFCKQSQGSHAGQSLKLVLFQKAKFEAMFGFVGDDGLRQYQEVLTEEGRKSGKSTEAAGIAIDMLCNDGEGAPEIYFIATKMDQAKKGFDEADRMRKKSSYLNKYIRKRASDLYLRMNEGIIKPLASDVKKLDGFNSSCVIVDELGAITNRRIYDDMKQSMASREQPLLYCITTNNFVRNGIFDSQIKYAKGVINGDIEDNRFLPFLYELDKEEEWTDPDAWIKANPGLGTIKKKSFLADAVKKAKNDATYKPTVLVKDFNLVANGTAMWLEFKDVKSKQDIDMDYLKSSYAIGGCDLSATTDLTCATLIIKKPDDTNLYVLQKYFLPLSRVEAVELSDSPEAPYRKWSNDGFLHICESATVDYHAVTQWFVDNVNENDIRPLWIGYDAALSGYWIDEMESCGFDMEKIRQGSFTWTYPFKQLRGEFQTHSVVYTNQILQWCLLNTAVKSANQAGIESQMPVKEVRNHRIDGTVSLLNAYTCMKNHEEEYLNYLR